MVSPIINTLGLCSGAGMLEEATGLGCEYFGWRAKPTCLAEWESYAASVLLARMEEKSLEPCPIWCGDLRDFDGKPFRGLVDILTAGLPCQPYSVAGKQRGNEDERSHGEDGDGPIPHALRIIGECEPAVVFLENVPPWVSGGWFRPVGEELCRMGYALSKPLFITAEAVGASHRRLRVFVMAHSIRAGRGAWARWERIFNGCAPVANARRKRIRQRNDARDTGPAGSESEREVRRAERERSGEAAGGGSATLALSSLGGLGELRESSGGDGLTDGSNQPLGDSAEQYGAESANGQAFQSGRRGRSVVNAGGKRRTKGNEPIQRSGNQPGTGEADDPSEGRSGLGDSAGELSSSGPLPGGSRDSISESSGLVGNANGSGRREQSHASNKDGAAAASRSVADTEQPRSQGDRPAIPQRGSEFESCDGDWGIHPLFAPGPGDFDGWGRVVADGSFDFRAPAVKPGVRVLASGVALVVDQSRADQLRCGGNGVVATTAAVAFIELMRRIRK